MSRRCSTERRAAPRGGPALDRRLVRPRGPRCGQTDVRARQPERADARRRYIEVGAGLYRAALLGRDRALRWSVAADKGVRSAALREPVILRAPGNIAVGGIAACRAILQIRRLQLGKPIFP